MMAPVFTFRQQQRNVVHLVGASPSGKAAVFGTAIRRFESFRPKLFIGTIMKLAIKKRTTGTKGEINKIRREGGIPAILYGPKQACQPICVDNEELSAIIRKMKPGLLATTVFELQDGNNVQKAIIKDLQYHSTTYAIEHVDFVILSDNIPVTLNVPIQIVGAADCVGVKLGGFVRQSIRSLKVTCLPKYIPQQFSVDVRDMAIADSKRLADIPMPENVRPRGQMKEVAVVISKKAGG
jgi:large subunit ribosomal protein L25